MNMGGTRLANSGNLFPLPRLFSLTLGGNCECASMADQMFRWRDDVTFVRQKDWTPQPAPNGNRPMGCSCISMPTPSHGRQRSPALNTGGTDPDAWSCPPATAAFSWFATASPMSAGAYGPSTFLVSAVVCYQRVLTQNQTAGQARQRTGG